MNDWIYKFKNYEQVLARLREAIDRVGLNSDDELLQAGLIQYFEFTFELAWKTLKIFLQSQGFTEINSPQKVIRTAFQNGTIQNGETWLKCLKSRNLTVHTYNSSIAAGLSKEIITVYFPLLEALYKTLQNENNS